MNYVTKSKKEDMMGTRGGKREGAGRKRKTGEPMVVKRVPAELVSRIDEFIVHMGRKNEPGKNESLPAGAMFVVPEPVPKLTPLADEKVAAGFPSPAEPYANDYLDFNEYLVKNREATIAVYCGGDSMLDAGMEKGDLLIIDRSLEPNSRDIVMADLSNEYTVKRLHMAENGDITLRSENASGGFPDFAITGDQELRIVGVVTHVIKNMR